MFFTVSATDCSNAAFYLKFVDAPDEAAACAAVAALGYRVDAVELTPDYVLASERAYGFDKLPGRWLKV